MTTFERSYAWTRQIDAPSIEAASTLVREALAAEGFGVLTEIDVQATLKKKLGVDRRPYLILGACNPPLARRALDAEPPVGLFLPCNVTLFEDDAGALWVQAIRPEAMFALLDNPDMGPIADEVGARLQRVMAALPAA